MTAPATPVQTSTGPEQRPVECVRVGTRDRAPVVEPQLSPGEIAVHTIDGRCHVIDIGMRD